STAPPSDLVMYAGSEALMVSTPDGQRRPYSAGLNRLAISPDGGELYYSAFTSRHLCSVDAKSLVDFSLADEDVARTIKDLGEVGISSHLETDKEGRVYISALEH